MSDVWFGPGLTQDDHDAFLTALALDPRTGAPLLAVADGEGEAIRLVMASYAFFDLFGVSNGEALSNRLLNGRDPGARRLAELSCSLPLGGAPRLERLRFLLGPGSEVITFLCRRLRRPSGEVVFVAAALGMRAGLMPTSPAMAWAAAGGEPSRIDVARAADPPALDTPASVPAIQAALAARWPGSRRLRFVWQSDAEGNVRQVSELLATVVGEANGDLAGKNLLELAPRLDPSGRLTEALAARGTWSGIDVEWPIADASGAVVVGLGAVPALDRERAFAGFRGYGVIHLDRVVACQSSRLVPAPPRAPGNIVPFPGGQRGFSAEDQLAFAALGAALRDRAGLAAHDVLPSPVQPRELVGTHPEIVAERAPEPAAPLSPVVDEALTPSLTSERPHPAPTAKAAAEPGENARETQARPPVAETPEEPIPAFDSAEPTDEPAAEVLATASPPKVDRGSADNGLAVLDRLALGLLVSRDNVPIFANRHLLDMVGVADEDALHEAGGLTHLFGDANSGEAPSVRGRDGAAIPASAHLYKIAWDGLPATLLTLQPVVDPGPAESLEAEHDAAIEEMARQHAEDRRRNEGELRHLRAILETATDGVASIDARGRLVSLNRSGEALFGRDRGMMLGRPFVELFAEENQKLAEDYLHGLTTNAARSLFNDGREILVKAPQGGTIPVFMTLGRLDASDEEAPASESEARFCALFRDLTHWKKVETELGSAKREAEAASAAKSDFLAKVSHEVRTPLNAIIGFAEVILEERFGPVGSDRYREYLRDIHTSGTHVMSLINDLLDLSKIEAGRMELSPTAIDANRIISECVGLMQPQASRARVIMRLSLAPHLPMIKADERSLRQIVLNLLSNAVKYNEPGGQVIVATAAPEDGKVVIRVRDTGAGMSEADIAAALEPFRQVSTRPLTEGTGLGLPLTKALVEANEASFLIRSKRDHGTLIEVAFPPARVLAGP